MEVPLNQPVRRYHGSTVKQSVAQEGFLEHGNCFFRVPYAKKLEGICNVVCLCRNWVDLQGVHQHVVYLHIKGRGDTGLLLNSGTGDGVRGEADL